MGSTADDGSQAEKDGQPYQSFDEEEQEGTGAYTLQPLLPGLFHIAKVTP